MPAKLRQKNVSHNTSNDRKESEGGNDTQKSETRAPVLNIKRILLRMVMIIGIMSLVYYSKKDQYVAFVRFDEEVTKRDALVPCSDDYVEELNYFPGCAPRRCGRVVFDSVVAPTEAMGMLNIAKRGMSAGGSSGGASILDLHSGALSYGNSFVNIYKIGAAKATLNSQDFKLYSHVKSKIMKAVSSHFGIAEKNLFLTHPTFFSRITSAPAQTIHDEYWHPHVDKETYESFHYTSLLYLTDYGRHFSGGRFVFMDKESNRTIEPKAGRVAAFTSGSENLHFVEPVTEGTRYAVTVSFTCDPKHAISDPELT